MDRRRKLTPVWAIVGALATWRIASVFYRDDITLPLRQHFGVDDGSGLEPESFAGRLLDCFWCTSVWAGGVAVVLYLVFPPLLLVPAWSFVAMLMDDVLENKLDW